MVPDMVALWVLFLVIANDPLIWKSLWGESNQGNAFANEA
jgi:hypothetical protein